MNRDELLKKIEETVNSITSNLDLSGNQISELPPQIAEPQYLSILNLSNNQLKQLPPQIGQLQGLRSLDLSGNQLSQLPSEITRLQQLEYLDLSGNPELPISEDFLDRLKTKPAFLISYYFDNLKHSPSQIRRSIEFPPEYREAGISILSYFNHILNTKYPDMEIGVTIEQKDTLVILIIDTPDGQQEIIEQELDQYGLVIIDRLPPEEYLSDPMEALRLKQELDMAKMRVQHTKELLYTEREQNKIERERDNIRFNSLEERTKFLETMLSKEQSAKTELIRALTQQSSETSGITRQALDTIIKIVERGPTESDISTLEEELTTIKNNDSSLFQNVMGLLAKGAIQGASGNILFEILKNLATAIN